jgi:hypothetical protein
MVSSRAAAFLEAATTKTLFTLNNVQIRERIVELDPLTCQVLEILLKKIPFGFQGDVRFAVLRQGSKERLWTKFDYQLIHFRVYT